MGREFAGQTGPGAVLGLVGGLGSGKTQFVKGLARGWGIKTAVTSPTFVVAKNYQLPGANYQLVHIDCYRLSTPEELIAIGFGELVEDKNNIIAVEWADKIKKIMPVGTIWIKFRRGKKENERRIESSR